MSGNSKKIQIQSVIYGNEKQSLFRAVKGLRQAVSVYRKRVGDIEAKLVYGDASPEPIFSVDDIEQMQNLLDGVMEFVYKPFGFNSGTARGHNMMAEECESEYMMIMNPDILLEPSCLIKLLEAIEQDKVGMVEARQTPLEHAKEYDKNTGETSWASTACTIFTKKVFDEVQGFDAETFFLYCDDLDFSWRVRMAGYWVLYVPSAVVYHSKSLTVEAGWKPTKAEIYYSAEAALLLAHKWSDLDRVHALQEIYKVSGNEDEINAVKEYERRKEEGTLPECIDEEHKIAQFLGDDYCEMRFRIGAE